MRILFVTQIVPYPPHGGVLQRGFNLLRELGRDHEVDLLAFHHPDELPPGEAVERSRAELGRFCASIEYFDLWPKRTRLHRHVAFGLGAIYPRPFSVLAHASRRLAARMAEISSSGRTDIAHLDTIALAPYRERCGTVPVVLAHHNVESQLMARRAEYETSAPARFYIRSQAKRLERYERAQAPRFPLNIAVSEADAANLRRLAPTARVAVVPNGVDTEYFTARPATGEPCLVYTGGMNMFANRDAVEWFLEAIWPEVKRAVPGARFFAIGQQPSERVLALARTDGAIEAPGFVDDVRPWVARSAVYVVPLRVGGGTRLKMLDAMAQGKAIVTTPLGAEGIEGVDGEHFILADGARAFTAAVIALLRDPERRERLGRAARARACERYAWPILGRELATHYAKVVEEARA